MELEAGREIPADSRTVFEIAADVSTMHRWLPGEIHVHEVAPGLAEADAETGRRSAGADRGGPAAAPGGHAPDEEGPDALMRTSPEQLRLEWGTRGRPDYTGWLQVTDQAGGASEVVVHLSFAGELPGEQGGASMARQELEESLDRLAGEVDRRAH